MKRILFSLLIITALFSPAIHSQDLEKVEAKLEEAKWLNEQALNAISEAETALRAAPVPVSDIAAAFISPNVLEVKFDNHSDKKLDVVYYAPEVHTEWQHSYAEYVNPIPPEVSKIVIGVAVQAEWRLKIVAGDWESKIVEVAPFEQPEPEKTEKKIKVIESNKSVFNSPVPNGLIKHDGKWRIYFFERNEDEMYYAESNDLESWSSHKKAGFQLGGGTNLVQDSDGDVFVYQGEGDQLYMYDLEGSDLDRLENKRLAYEWRIDGMVSMVIHDGLWYSTGRVRGSSPKSEGGWGDDLPEYPRLQDLPFIEQEFEEHLPSYRDPDDYIKDRRGISLHTSTDGRDWSDGQIIADPKDYDLEPMRGWREPNADGIGDFYASTLVDKNRMLVKLYKKQKSRVIDRWEYAPDMRIERRFRFTGETIIVPAVYENGKVRFTSTESVIPRDWFERRTPDAVEYPTCSECIEFGQTNTSNTVIFKDGYVYIPFGYRDDVHYEGRNFEYYTGIYIYRIPEEEFDQLFN